MTRKKIIILCIAIMALLGTSHAGSQMQEYTVKAAFLYNFAKFIEWPDDVFVDDQMPFTFCILGKDSFGAALDSIKDKTVAGRTIDIKRVKRLKDIGHCHILFISSSEEKTLQGIFSKLRNRSILTVGDAESFAEKGGIINFITINNKIRFEINTDAAKEAHLNISSKLLNLAKIVKGIE